MTKFFNKLKKHCFWPIFGQFSQFWGQKKNFSGKSSSVMHNFSSFKRFLAPYRNLEKIMIQFQVNAQTGRGIDRRMEGWTDTIL